jgi:vacuolar-type H+-ATPase subunit D/Vma8
MKYVIVVIHRYLAFEKIIVPKTGKNVKYIIGCLEDNTLTEEIGILMPNNGGQPRR